MTASLCDLPVQAFARYADTIAMGEAWRKLTPSMFKQPFEFTACNVQYARCRTYFNPDSWHKSFLCICYEFDVPIEQIISHKPMLYGRTYMHGRSRAEFEALTSPNGAHLVPELDMIVWHFPNDPQLPQLPELLDANRVVQHFPYASLPFPADAIVDIKIEVLRYLAEQRCILRYDISFGSNRDHFILYAKVFSDDNGERVFKRIQHCYEMASALGVQIARPLGYSAAVRAVWQAELSGILPTDIIDAGNYEAPMTAIGHCLAMLHAADLPMQKSITRKERLADVHKKSRKLGQMLPELASDLEAIIARSQSELTSLPPVQETVIHGDVHLGQFLITADNALALFDFDEWTRGDPAQDLADLIVDPHVSKFARNNTELNHTLPSDVARVFLASYRSHAGWTVRNATIAWHARVQLLNKAYRGAIQLEPRWREKASELVALATKDIQLE